VCRRQEFYAGWRFEKAIFCHVIDVFAQMQFLNDLVDLHKCGFHHRCSERFIVLSDL